MCLYAKYEMYVEGYRVSREDQKQMDAEWQDFCAFAQVSSGCIDAYKLYLYVYTCIFIQAIKKCVNLCTSYIVFMYTLYLCTCVRIRSMRCVWKGPTSRERTNERRPLDDNTFPSLLGCSLPMYSYADYVHVSIHIQVLSKSYKKGYKCF